MKEKYLIAVSGGVDSVVLLDKMIKDGCEVEIAHFDHGTREDSAADARFVKELAKKYDVPFVSKREELGHEGGEDLFRKRRYLFLFEEAKKRHATLVTAHHKDDAIETIAINILRGTGWRGLAVFDSGRVERPLLGMTKQDIREYALTHRLEWVEDSTNALDGYLRNRLRRRIARALTETQKDELISLWQKQVTLKREIDKELTTYISTDTPYDRYFFTYIDESVACEVLRAAVIAHTHQSPLRSQLIRALVAIKTAKAGATFELGGGVELVFTKRNFIVQTP